MNRFFRDLLERTLATYAVTLLGLLTASGVDLTDLGALQAAVIAAIPAGLSVVKGVLATLVGDPNSAALLGRSRE
ncbi:holin [Kitasatospora sp. CM 4170]|uniref:Holin n=1 Tax=Kitasatospora aburaviensis TaxID=67265 RepID=A0ABW1ER66_9ACTN|nr:holin [Kitasatospora sp. CM 4170]WNM45632.1 holin [Kitasatospora sp. CM 4170]